MKKNKKISKTTIQKETIRQLSNILGVGGGGVCSTVSISQNGTCIQSCTCPP